MTSEKSKNREKNEKQILIMQLVAVWCEPGNNNYRDRRCRVNTDDYGRHQVFDEIIFFLFLFIAEVW